jgi:AcrR family transcriptional regulator
MTNETKELNFDAAEELFAKNGFGSTSLHHITIKAGVNLASVNYHFGSKEALIKAIFERRIIPMNQGRLERPERLQQDYPGHEIPLDGLIEAFIEPAIARYLQIRKRVGQYSYDCWDDPIPNQV